jgi:transposase
VKLADLVFLDEFGAATNMSRPRARSPRGSRAVGTVPRGHWKVLSTIAAMTVGGMLCCGTFDGATDGDTFAAFVRDGLVPVLRRGQVVVMDNLAAHKSPAVAALVAAAGARVLYLPPYSPDLNPIEMAIAKVKALLNAEGARTVPDLLTAIGDAVAAITPDDAFGFVRHSGYAATGE